MKRLNKILLSMLVAVMCIGIVPSKVKAAGLTLGQLQNKFPNGAYWNHVVKSGHGYSNYQDYGSCNNPDGYTWAPCGSHNANVPIGGHDCNSFGNAMQCAGFAKKLGYDVYGSYCTSWGQTNINNVKPGDVIHYTGGDTDPEYGHWVFVIGVNGNAITLGEANVGGLCQIRWGRVIYKNQINVKAVYSAPYALNTSTQLTMSWEKLEQEISETNMYVKMRATTGNSGTYTAAGITVWDANGNKIGGIEESINTTWNYLDIWYDLTNELKLTLKKGTKYKFQLHTVFNGVRYTSNVEEFTTTGAVKLTGWQKDDKGWYYLDASGNRYKEGFKIMTDGIHYFDKNGYAINGWHKMGESWYLYNEKGIIKTGWQKVDGKWYYLNSNMKTGWQQIEGSWYYLNTDRKTGWQNIDGKWYYLGTDGKMQTNWQQINGKWYYLGTNGAMATGWQKIDNKWYYLGTDGAMATGWQKVDGKWYYLNSDMKTGWQKIDNKWYYLNTDMKTGWQKINNQWYYLNSDMKTGWQYINNKWYYFNANGVMLTGKQVIDGKIYTFDSNGVWI